ncbi:MAG: hypothetical protein ACEPO2_20525 [Pelagibaca sp.]
MTMANLLFTRDFDAEIDEERRIAECVVPVYSPDDLATAVEAARQEGFEEGFTQGIEEGRAEISEALEARRAEALEHLLPEIAALIEDRATHRACLEAEMAAYVRDVSETILPEILRSLGHQRIDAEIARIVKRAVGSPTLEIRVSPIFADGFAAELASPSDRDGSTIRVVPDAALEPSEVRASWRNGRSHYSFPALCRSILALVADIASSSKPKAEEGPKDV